MPAATGTPARFKQRDNTIASAAEYDLTEALTAYAGIGYRDGTNYQTFPDSASPATPAAWTRSAISA